MTTAIDELSALFNEIQIGNNLDTEKGSEDYEVESNTNLRAFDNKIQDVKSIMPKESKESEPVEVASKPKIIETHVEIETPKTKKPVVISEQNIAPVESEPKVNAANPLGLSGEDLQAYNEISIKYPQFTLFDGKQAYIDFYRYKLRALKSILTSFPILDFADMQKEVDSLEFKYQVSGYLPDPQVLGIKMGECQITRGRVVELLMRAQLQYPGWKKAYELMSAKLWKDHDLKGAHRRDGLTADHMSDINDYFTTLQGFIDSITTLDGFLKSTHDSLSRQIACVMIREKTGVEQDTISKEMKSVLNESYTTSTDSTLDGLDTIEHGTVISKTQKGGLIQRQFAGEMDLELLEDVG